MTDFDNDKIESQNPITNRKGRMGIVLLACNCVVLTVIAVLVVMLMLKNPEASEAKENIDDTQKIVYLDLDRVTNEVGLMARIDEKLEALKQQLSRDREKVRSQLQSEVTAAENRLRQLGNGVTEEQKEGLLSLHKKANARLSEADRQVTQLMNKNRRALIQAARTEILTNAEKIAQEQGATTIIELDTSILWHDNSQNITEQVVTRMKQ